MGTDIHAAIEYRNADGLWIAATQPNKYFGKYDNESETTARISIDRDYDLFAIWTAILPLMLKLGEQFGYRCVRLVMDFDS